MGRGENMFKKIVSLLLVFLIVLGTVAFAEDSNIEELQQDSATRLVKLGIIKGYNDGTLKLKNNISRAEFATMMTRLIGKDDLVDQYKTDSQFEDVTKTHWSAPYVNIAVKEGLIKGYPDGTFKPQNNISYGEVLTILIRLLGYEESVNTEDQWPINYVKKSVELGINGDLPISVNSNATRGDVSIFIDNSLLVKLNKADRKSVV